MKTIIITGGIGSGKSEICRFLSSEGIPVYDSDSRTKALYDENPAIVEEVEAALGEPLRTAGGLMDKAKVASIVFNDPFKLRALEETVHPYVFGDFENWRKQWLGKAPYVVMESAIYLRTPYLARTPGKVLLVEAPEELRIGRACLRDGVARERIIARMASQQFDESQADAVVINDSDIYTLRERALEAIEKLINE